MTRRTVRPGGRAYSRPPPRASDEFPMEVLLLLLDEIDDFVLMLRQRAGMLFH
ncbi:MAG: hypothetical protein JSR54_08170 [Proteobacteria bacterium]|nr:hypothetical protein [Pseudomonadota bacterium]